MIVKSDEGSNSQKMFTHSTIKVLHHSASQNFVTAFPCSLSKAYRNEHKDKLKWFAMTIIAILVTKAVYTPPPSTIINHHKLFLHKLKTFNPGVVVCLSYLAADSDGGVVQVCDGVGRGGDRGDDGV